MNEFNNQVNEVNNQSNNKMVDNQVQNETRKSFKLVIAIVLLLVAISGGTLAYFAFSASNNAISGEAGVVDLTLTVTKVLPSTTGTDDILVINFNELADSLNESCIDSDGEFALCQLYKVNLVNSSTGVGTNVKGSIAFDNENVPNLSWISLGTSYSSSTTYTSTMLGDTFNTASSTFTNFIDSYNLTSGTSIDFYILMWVNETEEAQTDIGTYGGTIRFEDSQGKGVTSTFSA